MATKKKDITGIGPSFLLVTAAVLFIYFVTFMTASNLRAGKTALLFGVFVSFCGFYTVSRIRDMKTGLLGLVAGIPCGIVSNFVLKEAFDSVNRMTIECFGIMMRFLLWGGIGCVVLMSVLLICAKKFKTGDAVTAVLLAGFALRTVMVVFTPMNYFQHDVSGFGGGFEGFHDDYIMYIYEHWALPVNDVRELGQLYHPPLHHALCAVFFKLHAILFPDLAGEINVLKTLPFLYTSWFVLISYRILKHFKIDGAPLVIALAFISFHPQLVFLAIQINNDALMNMLFAASIYLALKWYEKPELATILFTALTIGCAMMAKISGGLVAIPVGFLFLCKLIAAIRKKADIKTGELIKQFVFFGFFVFPLGMWFPLKNYIMHRVPFTYVCRIESTAHQDLWMFPAWKRLFEPSAESLKTPFMVMHNTDPAVDYNIFVSLIKTSLFDERHFENAYLINAGRVLMVLAAVVAMVCITCAVFVIIRLIRQKRMTVPFASVLILCVTMCISYMNYCLGYQITSTESLRFIIPVLIPASLFFGMTLQEVHKKNPVRVIIAAVIVLFICGVFAFYGSYAEYRPVWEAFIKPA